MKKILSAILALCMIASLSVQFASATEKRTLPSDETIQKTATTFPDAANNWALKYISYCTENSIFNGTSANTFNPNGNVTRAQFVVIVTRMFKGQVFHVEENLFKFTDITGEEWFADSLDWVTPYYDFSYFGDTFKPTQPITRAEAAGVLYNFIYFKNGNTAPAVSKHANYSDVDSTDEYTVEVVDYMADQGIMTGSNNKFNPDGSLTRAQLAAILFRMPILKF